MTVPPTTAPDGSRVPSGMPETATLRTPAERAPAPRTFRSQLAQAFAMFRNPKSIAGLIILGAFVLIAILAPWIAPYGPTQKDRSALRQPPSSPPSSPRRSRSPSVSSRAMCAGGGASRCRR